MAHKFAGPKDKTHPIAYLPIAIAAVALVAWVFASGYMRGAFTGRVTPRTTEVAQGNVPERVFNVRALAQDSSRDMLVLGRAVYEANCASCHGATGRGDGSQGRGLNPPVRNLHDPSDEWKNTASVLGIWQTLEQGISGGSMASYRNILDPEQRMAVTHFIRQQFVPDPPELTDDEIRALPAPGATQAGGTVTAHPFPGSVLISSDLASERIAVERPRPDAARAVPAELSALPGAALFGDNCASCHGPAGGGRESVEILTVHPFVRLSTPPLSESEGPWRRDLDAFRSLLVDDQYAVFGHGFGTLTWRQVEHLHEFTAGLAAAGQ